MTTLTAEQRHAIEKAGDAPVHFEDPETNQQYVVLRADVYARLCESLEPESSGTIPQGTMASDSDRIVEDPVKAMYPLVDRTFCDGWDTPEMSEYDDYEKHRP